MYQGTYKKIKINEDDHSPFGKWWWQSPAPEKAVLQPGQAGQGCSGSHHSYNHCRFFLRLEESADLNTWKFPLWCALWVLPCPRGNFSRLLILTTQLSTSDSGLVWGNHLARNNFSQYSKQGDLNKNNTCVFVTQNPHDNLACNSFFIRSRQSGRCCRVSFWDDIKQRSPHLKPLESTTIWESSSSITPCQAAWNLRKVFHKFRRNFCFTGIPEADHGFPSRGYHGGHKPRCSPGGVCSCQISPAAELASVPARQAGTELLAAVWAWFSSSSLSSPYRCTAFRYYIHARL